MFKNKSQTHTKSEHKILRILEVTKPVADVNKYLFGNECLKRERLIETFVAFRVEKVHTQAGINGEYRHHKLGMGRYAKAELLAERRALETDVLVIAALNPISLKVGALVPLYIKSRTDGHPSVETAHRGELQAGNGKAARAHHRYILDGNGALAPGAERHDVVEPPAVVSLVGKFEDEFDIEVPDRKIKLMKTVDDIVKFIEAATEE